MNPLGLKENNSSSDPIDWLYIIHKKEPSQITEITLLEDIQQQQEQK